MSLLFLDTSGWLAAVSPKEPVSAQARSAYRDSLQSRAGVLTTNLVMAEMHAMLLRRRGTADATSFLARVHADTAHEIIYVDAELERAAIDHWLRRYREAAFSLTDAVSFEVMRQRGIRTALTLDKHFAMAGFATLP